MKSSNNRYRKIFKFLLGTNILLLPLTVASCQAVITNNPSDDTKDKSKPETPNIKDKDKNPKTTDIQTNPKTTKDKKTDTTTTTPKEKGSQIAPIHSDKKQKNPPAVVTPPTPITPPVTSPKKEETTPKSNPNPGSTSGFPPFNPNDPDVFKHFPKETDFLIPSSASNLNTTDHFFINTPFQKPSQETIYKEIYDRSFAVGFTRKEVFNNQTLKPDPNAGYLSSKGTGWLLDYAVNKDKTKYSLFLATNLHVIRAIGNTFTDESGKKNNAAGNFDYTDPTGDFNVGVSLGKPSVDPVSFEPIPDKTPYERNTKGHEVKFYTNLSGIPNVDTGTKVSSIVGTTKLIFAGFDFMKQSEYNQFTPFVKSEVEGYLNLQAKTDSQYYWTKKFYDEGKLPQLYKDFAVFQIDVDFTKDTTEADNKFKEYILKAVAALDASIKRVKDNIVPNQDGSSVPYISYDYASIQKNPDIVDKRNENRYKYAQQYVDDVLTAGYPSAGERKNSTAPGDFQYWARNNPTERYSFPYKTIGKANTAYQLSGLRLFLNRPLAEYYGFKYANLKYSALPPGTSGSIGYSDYGLPIGIHSDYDTNNSTGYDISLWGGLTTFNQSSDIPFEIYNVNTGALKATFHAYNMIDGSNSKLYPYQKNSYRQNISVLYPNGIGPDKIMKTAIFPNGYLVK